jgi:hypothetical protein
MKKLILTAMGLIAGATLVQAQGFIAMYGPSAAITTNSTVTYSGTPTGGGSTGRTLAPALTFDYALLFATSTTAGDSSPLGADWQLATLFAGGQLLGNNFVGNPGGMTGPNLANGVQVNLASGTTYSALLVGWSATLGSTWGTVSALLAQNFSTVTTAGQYYGQTGIGSVTPFSAAGAGDPLVFPTVFPNGSLVLGVIPTPEPTTLALAGLGGLSMLFLRRRKA